MPESLSELFHGWREGTIPQGVGVLRVEVDGIVSEIDVLGEMVSPMFSFKYDSYPLASSRQCWHDPPTEAELDEWVKLGDEEMGWA
jgi:hypothetical protein